MTHPYRDEELPEAESCGSCRFQRADACCKSPPRVVPTGPHSCGTRWPSVPPDSWCGEHEPKVPPIDPDKERARGFHAGYEHSMRKK